jgi:N-acyl-D-aspartate/D-glutamate deacylase
MEFDLALRGGLVVDGTGRPPFVADVGVVDGVIAGVGQGLRAERSCDAAGAIVTPGFVDIHTHYDAQIHWDPWLTSSCYHGVTSVLAGNCGLSLAPCAPEFRETFIDMLESVEDMRPDTLRQGVEWNFETFPEYLDLLRRRGVGLNFGALVGHNALRIAAMGEAAHERSATAAELAQMVALLDESMAAGALGLSVDRSRNHFVSGGRPTPSLVADLDEVEALLSAVGRAGRLAQVSPGDELEWLYEVQPRVGCRITWGALLAFPPEAVFRSSWQTRLALHEARHLPVYPQVSSLATTFQITMLNPSPFVNVPAIHELMGVDGRRDRIALCQDPDWLARAREEIASGCYVNPRWDKFMVDESPQRSLVGMRVSEIAASRGLDPLDAMIAVAVADDLATRFRVVFANDNEDDVRQLLLADGCVLGISDAGAHVTQICDAPLATDFLAHWVRDREVMPLEQGVHRLTGELADLIGLHERGRVSIGQQADLLVIDLDDLDPGPTRRVSDLPAGGDRLVADQSSGIRHMFVNGRSICASGEWCLSESGDALPGEVLGPTKGAT